MIDNDLGASGAPSQNISDDSGSKEVSYETHRKLLGQRKGDQATIKELSDALNVFREAEAAANEQKAIEKGNFEKVLADREVRLKETQAKYDELNSQISRARKLNAFDEVLGSRIKHEDFYNFVDTDSIQLDENGVPLKETVELAVNSFKERYGDTLIAKKEVAKLPGDAPGNTTFQTGKTNVNDKKAWNGAINRFLGEQKG